jgi:hypothetical protein
MTALQVRDEPAAAIAAEAASNRRGDLREHARLGVATTCPGYGGQPYLGTTVDVSATGLCVFMDTRAPAKHLEVWLANGQHSARISVRVVDHYPAAGGFVWHLLVIEGDDGWHRLTDA